MNITKFGSLRQRAMSDNGPTAKQIDVDLVFAREFWQVPIVRRTQPLMYEQRGPEFFLPGDICKLAPHQALSLRGLKKLEAPYDKEAQRAYICCEPTGVYHGD